MQAQSTKYSASLRVRDVDRRMRSSARISLLLAVRPPLDPALRGIGNGSRREDSNLLGSQRKTIAHNNGG